MKKINKIIALLTSSITMLVAIFIFICPLEQTAYVQMTSGTQNGCEETTIHTIAPHNDFANNCINFHTKNAGLFLNMQNKIIEASSFIFSFGVFTSLIFIAFTLSVLLSVASSRFRHRLLFFINILKRLHERKFKHWLSLLSYSETVSLM